MRKVVRRFPRTVLFARAAHLQQQIEEWQGNTSLQLQHSSNPLMSRHAVTRLKARQEYLEGARQAATRLRTLLYDCP
jgi:hypothetical protein